MGLAALAPHWHLLRSPAGGAARNMATDAALMARARRTGTATLRVYTWTHPTLSLGRNERARDRYDDDAIRAAGLDVVRRPTGGRALLHHRELTYSVTAPARIPLAESYAAINALLLDALARLGVRARLAEPGGRPLRPEGAACFAEPAAGEIVAGGGKLVGSAQLREDGALLQHGSVLIADDQPLIARVRRAPGVGVSTHPDADTPTAPAATLTDLLQRDVTAGEVADALVASLAAAVPFAPLDEALLQDDLARLVIAFADPAWTWRR